MMNGPQQANLVFMLFLKQLRLLNAKWSGAKIKKKHSLKFSESIGIKVSLLAANKAPSYTCNITPGG
jgi:hypothetical protein